MFVEIVKIINHSNIHHFVLLKQQSKQKLSILFRVVRIRIFMTDESKKFENNLSTKDKSG